MLQSQVAPIAYFCYNRPDHTRRSLEALRKNYLAPQSKLFIFSDGPKNEKAVQGVKEVREYIKSNTEGFASVEIIEREKNYTCPGNIIDGCKRVAEEFGRLVVVEDDILTSPYFLTYINDGLELYKDDDKVGAISAWLDPQYTVLGDKLPESFFMNVVHIWGWGTWWRVWKDYEFDAGKLLEQIKAAGREDEFNLGVKSKPNSRNLQLQAAGKICTWDYQLGASAFLHNRISLSSRYAYSNNIGCDGTGIHCGPTDYYKVNVRLSEEYHPLKKIPIELNEEICKIRRRNLWIKELKNLIYRALRKIYRILTGKNKVSKR